MADTTGPLTVHLTARTGLARAFIALASVPVVLGWKPSERACSLIERIAVNLIRTAVVEHRRSVFPWGASQGYREFRRGPRYLHLSTGRARSPRR